MGILHYGAPAVELPIDDRTLAHLELVIVAKLRRSEGFAFSLADDTGRRDVVWLSSATTLRFTYDGPMPEINRVWMQELADVANTPGGLRVTPEPDLRAR